VEGMRFRVLGWIEARDAAGQPVDLGGSQPKLVTAMLLAAAGQVVSTDSLIDTLWTGSPPSSASGTIQSYVSRLRRAFEALRRPGDPSPMIVHEPPGYRLPVAADDVDFRRFERLADEGRTELAAGRPEQAAATLRSALEIWRGDPAPELAEHEFGRGITSRLRNRHRAALADRVAADLELGRHAALVGELAELVTTWPLEETFRAHLAVALYRSGRQSEALRAIDDARTTLREELGVEPGRPLRDLEVAILQHDPSLDRFADGGTSHPRATEPGGAGSAPLTEPEPVDRAGPAAEQAPSAGSTGEASGDRSSDVLVGRRTELGIVLDALAEARTSTRWIVIEGEPGIGKTRLAEEVGRRAANAGGTVLWGRAFEGGAAPAFWPWLPILRALAAEGETVTPMPAELARLIAPEGSGDDAAISGAARFNMFEAIAQVIEDGATRAPLTIVLDDLQWADAASLELLRALVARVRAPMLVVVTVRELDIGRVDDVVDTLATLTRAPGSRRLRLFGLDAGECTTLVQQTVGRDLDPVACAEIDRRADGNPFFITELARLVATEGSDDVPAGVRDVVARRLSALPASTRALLEQAAIIGRDADLDVLAAALQRTVDECLDELEPALVHRLVLLSPDTMGAFRFAHALVRDTVIGGLSPVRTARAHLRAADALEALRPSDDHAEIIAEHLLAATPVGVARRAASALERAAAVAMRRLAFGAAERLLDRAWQLRRSSGGPAELEAELGTVSRIIELTAAQRGYAALHGSAVLERGKWLAEQTGNETVLVTLLYGEWAAVDVAGRMQESVPLAAELFARAERSDMVRTKVTGHTAHGILAWRRGALAVSAEHLDLACNLSRTLPEAERAGSTDLQQLHLCEPFSMLVHDLMGDLGSSAKESRRVIAIYPDDPYWELLVLNFIASGATVVGDVERAARVWRRGAELDPERAAGFWSNALRGYGGAARCLAGDVGGVAVVDEAIAAYEVIGLRTAMSIWLAAKARVLAVTGDVDAARAAAAAARTEMHQHGELYMASLLAEAEAYIVRAAGGSAAEVTTALHDAWQVMLDQHAFGCAPRLRRAAEDLDVELPDDGRLPTQAARP